MYRIHAPREGTAEENDELRQLVPRLSRHSRVYFTQLKKNTDQGSRGDSGRDELGLAFLIDDDLAEILARARSRARTGRSLVSRDGVLRRSIIPSSCHRSSRPPASRRESSGCTIP